MGNIQIHFTGTFNVFRLLKDLQVQRFEIDI